MKFPVAPMKATMTALPVGDDWAFEVKWDGYRTIVHIADGTVRHRSHSHGGKKHSRATLR